MMVVAVICGVRKTAVMKSHLWSWYLCSVAHQQGSVFIQLPASTAVLDCLNPFLTMKYRQENANFDAFLLKLQVHGSPEHLSTLTPVNQIVLTRLVEEEEEQEFNNYEDFYEGNNKFD